MRRLSRARAVAPLDAGVHQRLAIGVEGREGVEGCENVWRQNVGVFVREVAANLQS